MNFIAVLEQSYNLCYSFCVLVALAIWGLSALGLLGGEHIDGGVDLHDGSIDIAHTGGWLHGFADTLGIGMVPTSILATLQLFFMGVAGMLLNEWLLPIATPASLPYYGLWTANFIGATGIGLGLTALINRPLRYLFKDYGKTATANSIVGKVAKVSSGKVTATAGQALVALQDGNTVEVAVRLQENQATLLYGQQILIVDFDQEKNVYLVAQHHLLE
jgi:Protein of unknown function (DUF1449)